jgi:hypothetical protein
MPAVADRFALFGDFRTRGTLTDVLRGGLSHFFTRHTVRQALP